MTQRTGDRESFVGKCERTGEVALAVPHPRQHRECIDDERIVALLTTDRECLLATGAGSLVVAVGEQPRECGEGTPTREIGRLGVVAIEQCGQGLDPFDRRAAEQPEPPERDTETKAGFRIRVGDAVRERGAEVVVLQLEQVEQLGLTVREERACGRFGEREVVVAVCGADDEGLAIRGSPSFVLA